MSSGKARHSDQRELSCCGVAIPEATENALHKNFVRVINNSLWGEHHLVMKAEDTPYRVCQGRMPRDGQHSVLHTGIGFLCSKRHVDGGRG